MKYIELGINLTDDLGIKSILINHNETDLPSDSELIKRIAFTLLKSIVLNDKDLQIQDMLNELNIARAKT